MIGYDAKRNHNTCALGWRVFSALPCGGRLAISEVLLEEELREVQIVVDAPLTTATNVSLCAFNDVLFALTLGPLARDRTAMLIRPGPRPLSLANTRVTRLKVPPEDDINNAPNQILQITETELLLSAAGSGALFRLTVQDRVEIERLSLRIPGLVNGCTLVALEAGDVFAVGGYLGKEAGRRVYESRVTRVDVWAEECTELAPVPGTGRSGIACLAIGRFILMNGGYNDRVHFPSPKLYDTETQRTYQMPPFGRARHDDAWCCLVMHNKYVYTFGGMWRNPGARLHLKEIADRISSPEARRVFESTVSLCARENSPM